MTRVEEVKPKHGWFQTEGESPGKGYNGEGTLELIRGVHLSPKKRKFIRGTKSDRST